MKIYPLLTAFVPRMIEAEENNEQYEFMQSCYKEFKHFIGWEKFKDNMPYLIGLWQFEQSAEDEASNLSKSLHLHHGDLSGMKTAKFG